MLGCFSEFFCCESLSPPRKRLALVVVAWSQSSCKVIKDCGSEMFTFPNAVLVEFAFITKCNKWWNVWYNLAHSLANRPSDFKRHNFAAMWSNTNQWLKKICVSALINHFLYLQNRYLEWLLSWSFRCWFEWFIASILNNALWGTHLLYIYLFAHKLKWTSFHKNTFSISLSKQTYPFHSFNSFKWHKQKLCKVDAKVFEGIQKWPRRPLLSA